jgi:hypothetical protein
MPQTRKLVRDAIKSALADTDDGFNATLAAIAATYGIDPFTIDWSDGSGNFIEANLDETGARASRLVTGVTVSLYTSESRNKSLGENRSKTAAFEGTILAHLDIRLDFRDGEDVNDDLTEDVADAVEDAIIQILVDPQGPFRGSFEGPVYFSGDFACLRPPIEQLAEGYAQLLPFQLLYEVHA